jgi:alkylation response protein AidB-like acyl-CoA dehydrogenase
MSSHDATASRQPMTMSDEQHEFRAVLRRFCEERIAPGAAERDARAEFDWDAFKEMVELDLPALQMPAEYGGTGASLVTQAVVAEELARVCASTSLAFLISKLGMLPVINFGSEELKRTYIPRVAAGTSQASYALSEPDAGSDVAAMTTRAVRDGDDWVISGTKCWITNAGISDLYLVFAKTDPNEKHRGITAFLVEAEWGVKVAKLEHKLGIRSSPTGIITLDEVRVPDTHRVGALGQGFTIAMHTLDRSRPTIGAQAVGIAQGALDYAVAYMKERRTFGRPIGDNQGLQWMAADAATKIEAARGLVYRACALADEDDPYGDLSKIGAMSKAYASDVAMEVTTDCVQFLGGYGYTTEFPVERMMRDAKITQIYEGTNQIQRIVIAKHVMK